MASILSNWKCAVLLVNKQDAEAAANPNL